MRAHLTAHPRTIAEQFLNSALVWLALMALWVGTDILMVTVPSEGRPVRPDSWLTHLVFTLLGLIAIWCMPRTGFPAAWDARTAAGRRLLRPVLFGAAFGVLAIVVDRITGASEILAAALGSDFNVAFPGSLWVYTGGAIVWEAVFRLLPIPLLLWLVSGVILKGRGQQATFWVLAALTSAIEPAMQGVPLTQLAGGAIGPGVFAAYALQSYALNFTAAVCFRQYGLLAAVLLRWAYYLVWHVAYGYFTM